MFVVISCWFMMDSTYYSIRSDCYNEILYSHNLSFFIDLFVAFFYDYFSYRTLLSQLLIFRIS